MFGHEHDVTDEGQPNRPDGQFVAEHEVNAVAGALCLLRSWHFDCDKPQSAGFACSAGNSVRCAANERDCSPAADWLLAEIARKRSLETASVLHHVGKTPSRHIGAGVAAKPDNAAGRNRNRFSEQPTRSCRIGTWVA
jgi:hypothetical protein